ncbi:hypothetical protein Goe27_00490 [Bacillus phage vB_BsuM-Goe27]|uniref:Uncharacterized protein n=1 Tax=Bacillus phage vB_BsuM-Goe3 TaxID=1933063 RepID=A0A217ER12_BPGO3|nr:terminase small subunit [Bacillus phage vB_BsuM-Goe3]AYJ75918.1 hypothetical protein BSP14_043 [Bacillus phage BSP14]AYJ76233.1 hypothetical protein BSP12_047 [Bacillus phage BSP12]QDP43077.1 hypothetical protein Goe7_c00470 [Bacillus phage vB_BveM-Goe7]UJJ74853.1 hypothetical protein [Bacillus phage BM-P1]WCS68915.1 hypothetical protein Goe17_00510 [Bacillus phage vB_BsuM-Goe17]WCS69169.1 hypothetical protein Goe20_00470 [Bacillus phage vB_BsuM-Goe20]WCS69428.1 hypothetical protein Goe24
MSMSENIRSRVLKKRSVFSSEEEVRERLNAGVSRTLDLYLQRLEAGEIPIDNASDLVRIIGAYKEINGISEAMEGKAGQATLPEINMKQDREFEEDIREGKIASDEEGMLDVTDMSTDDVADLIQRMDSVQNRQNEGGF